MRENESRVTVEGYENVSDCLSKLRMCAQPENDVVEGQFDAELRQSMGDAILNRVTHLRSF